jgi:hypothetical protein
VQPDGEAEAGQAQCLGRLPGGQAMPGQQRQDVAVALAQPGQGCQRGVALDEEIGRVCRVP